METKLPAVCPIHYRRLGLRLLRCSYGYMETSLNSQTSRASGLRIYSSCSHTRLNGLLQIRVEQPIRASVLYQTKNSFILIEYKHTNYKGTFAIIRNMMFILESAIKKVTCENMQSCSVRIPSPHNQILDDFKINKKVKSRNNTSQFVQTDLKTFLDE